MSVRNAKGVFFSRGFSNWKLAMSVFRQHELSNCHKKAVEKIITLPATTLGVGEMLSKAHAQEKSKTRQVLLTILSNLRFLVRQAYAIWGDGNRMIVILSNFLSYMVRIIPWYQACTQGGGFEGV